MFNAAIIYKKKITSSQFSSCISSVLIYESLH